MGWEGMNRGMKGKKYSPLDCIIFFPLFIHPSISSSQQVPLKIKQNQIGCDKACGAARP